ncbi:MAG: S4 domain-containing protein [Bacteroidales bacterium]|nr:S4 domain-containing protein [Bacteroidales bacterium]
MSILWSIRIFKTRSKAAEACKKGKIFINDEDAKPAKEVRVGDEVMIKVKNMQKTLKITGLLEQRVSASIAETHYEDLTPPEEDDKLKKDA